MSYPSHPYWFYLLNRATWRSQILKYFIMLMYQSMFLPFFEILSLSHSQTLVPVSTEVELNFFQMRSIQQKMLSSSCIRMSPNMKQNLSKEFIVIRKFTVKIFRFRSGVQKLHFSWAQKILPRMFFVFLNSEFNTFPSSILKIHFVFIWKHISVDISRTFYHALFTLPSFVGFYSPADLFYVVTQFLTWFRLPSNLFSCCKPSSCCRALL
jgi:hypothetical protein